MIYAHYDLRYIKHAMPDLYADHVGRVQNLWNLRNARDGRSYSNGLPAPTRKLEMLAKRFMAQLGSGDSHF